MDYILVYDIITAAVKTSVFTADGRCVRSVSHPLEMTFNGLHAQQSADDWWAGVKATTKKVLDGLNPSMVAAISFTDQVQVCLCVDKNAHPLHPAITWSDKRALEVDDPIAQMPDYRVITAQMNSPCTSVRKLLWVKRKHPEIYNATCKMIGCKDYIVLKMTGKFVTDYSVAGSTGAFDVHKMSWSRDIIDACGLDFDKFPEATPSHCVVGKVSAQAAAETGLAAGTPIVCGAGDFTCSAVGAGAIERGDTYLNLGSSSWVATVSDTPFTDTEMNIVNCVHVGGKYLPLANVQEAGAAFKWLNNRVFSDSDADAGAFKNVYPFHGMEQLVRRSPAGANGLTYIPYILGASATNPDESASGAFLGLKMSHGRADMARAAIEGVSMDMNLALEFFRKHADIKKLTATGIASREKVWLEVLANTFNAEIAPSEIDDATVDSIGAAIIAGVGVGIFDGYRKSSLFYGMKPSIMPSYEKIRSLAKRGRVLYNSVRFADVAQLVEH